LRERIVAAQEVREEDFIERPTDQIFRKIMNEFGYPELPQEVVDDAMQTLYAESEEHWLPVEGLRQILDDVKEGGYHMGLISNASDVANVHRLIDKVGVRPYFDPILVSAGVGVRKPAPLIFQKLLHQWNLAADQTVMIGDTLNADVLGAKRLGMHQIWLKTAADRPDNLDWLERVEPERVVDQLAEVPALLNHWSET
jgi:putative hydrolase of the HAD superfamily